MDGLDLDKFENVVQRLALQNLGREDVAQPFLLDPSPDSPDTLVGTRGHRFDFQLEVLLFYLDALRLGNPCQDEELLERTEGHLVGIGADLGLAGPDVSVREALLSQLYGEPGRRALLLARDQIRGQLEGGCRDQGIEDLAADRLLLLRRILPLERFVDRLAQFLQIVEADRLQELGIDLGQPDPFEVIHRDLDVDRLAPQVRVRHGRTKLGFDLPGLARLDAFQGSADPRDMTVLEPKFRLQPELDLLDLVEHATVGLQKREVGREIIADPGCPLELGNDLRIALEEAPESDFHILVANRPDRPLDLQALVLGDRELGPNLHVHLECHRAVVGKRDRLDIELGLDNRVELVILVDLLERGHQERRLDLIGDLLAKSFDNKRPGSTAGAEPWDLGIALKVTQRFLELTLDLGSGDRDLEVLLTGTDILNLDVELELSLGLGFFTPLGGFIAGLIGHRDRGIAFIFAVSHLGLSLGSHLAGTA